MEREAANMRAVCFSSGVWVSSKSVLCRRYLFCILHFAFDMLVSPCFFVAPSISPPLSHILLANFALLRHFLFSAVLLYLPDFFFGV